MLPVLYSSRLPNTMSDEAYLHINFLQTLQYNLLTYAAFLLWLTVHYGYRTVPLHPMVGKIAILRLNNKRI